MLGRGKPEVQERVLVASRRTIGLHALGAGVLLALCLCWIAAGLASQVIAPEVRLRRAGATFVLAAIGAVASAAALVASLGRAARPYRIRITPEALLVERSLEQRRRISWIGVQEFYVTGDGQSPRIAVRFDRAHALSGLAMGGGLGSEEVLSVGEFDLSAYSIAQLLNQALREGVEPSPTPAPAADPAQPRIVR